METTKLRLKREFEQHYPATTAPDVREEAWNVFLDNAHREGRIPAKAVDTWSNPYTPVKEPNSVLTAVCNDAKDAYLSYTTAQGQRCVTPELRIAVLVAHSELAEVLQRLLVDITNREDVLGDVPNISHVTLAILSYFVLTI